MPNNYCYANAIMQFIRFDEADQEAQFLSLAAIIKQLCLPLETGTKISQLCTLLDINLLSYAKLSTIFEHNSENKYNFQKPTLVFN